MDTQWEERWDEQFEVYLSTRVHTPMRNAMKDFIRKKLATAKQEGKWWGVGLPTDSTITGVEIGGVPYSLLSPAKLPTH